MKISVITVCYNAKENIETTILSVLAQKYADIEYVMIDGGSTDGTLDIIGKYRNRDRERIDYLVSEPDKGIYHAMSKGVKASSGDVLYFLNAGDEFYDEFVVENIVREFKKHKTDIVFGDLYYKSTDDSGNYLDTFKPDSIHSQSEIRTKFDLYDKNIHHQTAFYSKKIFKNCTLYREDLDYGSDYMLNVEAIVKNNYKAKYTDLVIAKFLLGGVSTDKETAIRDYEKARNFIRDNYFKNSVSLYLHREIIPDLSTRLYLFLSKYCRSLLRIYDNSLKLKNIKRKADMLIARSLNWSFE